MFTFRRALAVAGTAALLAAPGAAGAQLVELGSGSLEPVGGAPETPPPTLSPDRVIVQWAAGARPAERRDAREDAEVEFSRDLGNRRFQLVETEPGQTPGDAVRELEADPAVALAERDGYYHLHALPDDPLFGQLWGLRNVGLGVNGFEGTAVPGADVDALGAWERTIGTPETVVAVIDSGYRFEHPDLENVAWTNPDEDPNGLDDDGNGIVDDLHGADFAGEDAMTPTTDGDPSDDDLYSGGHGVHVAGTIGAEGGNGIGITGVAQDVSIMPVRACSRIGIGNKGCPQSSLISAINYAGAEGARVVNMSLGGENVNVTLASAIAENEETLFVVSAGNEEHNNEQSPKYPCNYNPVVEERGPVDNVVCVAATDQADRLAWFSNWGAKAVDLGAPGTETLSTHLYRAYVEDDFELDDLASRWIATGPDGGFGRAAEAPLTSFGITDSPGGPAQPNASLASRSVPITLPAGLNSCTLEATLHNTGEKYLWLETFLDGELVGGVGTLKSDRFSFEFLNGLSDGGELSVELRYEAPAAPKPSTGVWVDDLELRCRSHVGEAAGYRFMQGTSMAAPHVAGTAALLFSLKPGATVSEVRVGLLGSAERIAALAGKTVTGGRLDAAAATDLFDDAPPPPPALSATNPPSPAKAAEPKLIGSAQRGTSVEVFANATCAGAPIAGGSAAQLAAGIAVGVAEGATTQLSVRATDLAPHTSSCSAPISYTREKATIDPGGEDPGGGDPGGGGTTDPGGGGGPSSGGGPNPPPDGGDGAPGALCTVPRLVGKTLPKAKAALRRAACKLGKVRRPPPRQGKRPRLVVKSSRPGAGARPAGGSVEVTLGPKPRRARR